MNPGSPQTRESLILRLPDATDAEAWDEFVTIYAPLIQRLAQKQGLQPSDADDLVQEVMTSVSQSVSRWLERDDRGSFRAWLFRMARNQAVNLLTRRKTKALATGGSAADQQLHQLAAASCESDFELEYRREVFRYAAMQVREAVCETSWTAFWMTHVEGQSVDDVAGQLKISAGSVYVARSRVMARLRDRAHQMEASQ